MRGINKIVAAACVLYLLLAIVLNVMMHTDDNALRQSRNVLVNRMSTQFQSLYVQRIKSPETDGNQASDGTQEKHAIQGEKASQQTDASGTDLLRELYESRKAQLQKEYGKENLPDAITFLTSEEMTTGVLSEDSDEQRVAVIINEEGEQLGLLLFQYTNQRQEPVIFLNVVLLVCFLFVEVFISFIRQRILKPFTEFQNYPEKLAKNELSEKLPETKNRYFGRFIWGVNMLSDCIRGDKQSIHKLMEERQTLLTTIAHGIKTPVANVKLYAAAIEMGLYQKDGVPNEEDAKIAKKIEKNADEITELVKEMLETTSTGMVEFEPKIELFYVKEIATFIQEEFGNRFSVNKIPYTINNNWDGMLENDKEGLFRIVAQLLENAIKYGDGKQITIDYEKQEEGFFLSVRNHGVLIEEKEIPFLFNSFWRGSNAEFQEGSGIGLFEAKTIAVRMGGDIFVKRLTDTNEMEFVVYLP